MSVDHIRYDILAQDALRGVVRTVLTNTAKKGLQGEHHLFISFDTRAEGVRLSARVRAQYPEEMTIVLQHQFWDLKVNDEGFEVGLSFAGVPEKLWVPFTSIKSFVDPSVQFALQFEPAAEGESQSQTPAAAPVKTKPELKSESKSDKDGKTRKPVKPTPLRTVPNIPAIPARAPTPLPSAAAAPALTNPKPAPAAAPSDDKPSKPKRGGSSGGGEVVRLDRFRKKK